MIDVYIGKDPANKKKFDCDDEIEIVRQVMDIFDISIRTVDYSKTIKGPKTANNREILEGLGFSDSEAPYKRLYADVYIKGILIMQNAFVKAKKTSKEYELAFLSESKEIWKVIGNDTLDLLSFDDSVHTKSSSLIKTQWESGITDDTKFYYFFADYGGKLPSSNTVYGQYIIPSYRVPYIVSKIEAKYNVTFNLSVNTKLNDTFITFSDANEIENTGDVVKHEQVVSSPTIYTNLTKYIIEEDGIYDILVTGYTPFGVKMEIWIGDYHFDSGGTTVNINGTSLNLKKNNQISFLVYGSGLFTGTVRITRKAINISGNAAFKNFKITDFLKEIIYQSAGIPVKRRESNVFDFITIKDIVDNDPEDWSAYYQEDEKEEGYIIGKYAQNNFFRYKYEEKEDSNKDGVFIVGNQNLETNEDIIKSVFYNTPVNPTKTTLGGTDVISQQYQLWRRTVEQNNGAFEERYQPLSGRMFLLSGKNITTSSNFNISTNGVAVSTNKITIANNEDYNFQRVINLRYKEFSQILQRPKIINVKLNLPIVAFANFDFKRRVYIKQLGGYFIVNRIPWKPNKLTSVELIRANINVIDDNEGGEIPDINLFFLENGSTGLTKTVLLDGTYTVSLNYLNIPGTDPVDLIINGSSYPFTKTGTIIDFTFTYPYDLNTGVHVIKLVSGTLESNEIKLRLREKFNHQIIDDGFENINEM